MQFLLDEPVRFDRPTYVCFNITYRTYMYVNI
jgi:hypothetical protein